MILASHPTGNEFVRYTLAGLNNKKLLSKYYTSIACFEGDLLYKLGSLAPFAELRKRTYDSALKRQTEINPFPELMRQFAIKASIKSFLQHETGRFCVDKIYQNHDQFVARHLGQEKDKGTTGIYAYEDASFETFLTAEKLTLNRFYDLSIGYWKAAKEILEKEKERQPAYAASLTGLLNSEAKLERKNQEIELANHIIVASKFTAETLKLYPGQPKSIHIIPYGFPAITKVEKKQIRKPNDPLKVLFVGGLTQRKGIAEVFESAKLLKGAIELTVIGRETNFGSSIIKSNLSKHRYFESLPHHQILEEMRNNDVLLFPSFFEGFGMVISEAMSQGTPVITTLRTGAADFIEHGINGWMVEPGKLSEIITILENLIENPEVHMEVGLAAKKTASQRPWTSYSLEMSELLLSKSLPLIPSKN